MTTMGKRTETQDMRDYQNQTGSINTGTETQTQDMQLDAGKQTLILGTTKEQDQTTTDPQHNALQTRK